MQSSPHLLPARTGKAISLLFTLLLLITPVLATHTDTPILADWRFNETGGDLIDHSGNGFHGTLHGDIERGLPGVNNSTGYRFDGQDDWIEIPGDPLLDPGDTVSLEAWFRAGTFSSEYARLFQRGVEASYGMLIEDTSTGWQLRFIGRTDSYNDVRYNDYTLDSWDHAVGTYNGTQLRLYLNGELVGQRQHTGMIQENDDSNASIGSWPDESGFFNGSIDQLQIYDGVLDSSQVQYHYQHPPGWDPSPESGTENDTTADNETADDGTGNETADGTDEGTPSENETTTDNETDDSSLFEGGNGTDQEEDTTDNDTTSANGTTGNETLPENQTDTSDSDSEGQQVSIGGASFFIDPQQIEATVTAGSTTTTPLTITNTGNRSTRLSFSTSLDILSPSGQKQLSPGQSVRLSIPIDASQQTTETTRTGSIRLLADGVSKAIPATVHIIRPDRQEPGNGHANTTLILSSTAATVENELYIPVDRQQDVTVTVTVRDQDGNTVHQRTTRKTVDSDTNTLRLRYNESLPAGTYMYNMTASTDGIHVTDTTQFSLDGPPATTAPALEGQSTSRWPITSIGVLLLILLGGTVLYYRDSLRDTIQTLRQRGRDGRS